MTKIRVRVLCYMFVGSCVVRSQVEVHVMLVFDNLPASSDAEYATFVYGPTTSRWTRAPAIMAERTLAEKHPSHTKYTACG